MKTLASPFVRQGMSEVEIGKVYAGKGSKCKNDMRHYGGLNRGILLYHALYEQKGHQGKKDQQCAFPPCFEEAVIPVK